MAESLAELEHQRGAILQQMLRLPDFRSGSITATRGTCGKPSCRSIKKGSKTSPLACARGCGHVARFARERSHSRENHAADVRAT